MGVVRLESPTIIVPGGTGAGAGARGTRGPAIRTKHARDIFGLLPAWRCQSLGRGVFYLCGRCFGRRGDGPATNSAEIWQAGTDRDGTQHHEVVPAAARCEECGGRAWPRD